MEKTFKLLSLGTPDLQGDTFLPGSIKLREDKKVYANIGFDLSNTIGVLINLKEDGANLIATVDFREIPVGLVPAIGYKVVKSKNIDGKRTIEEATLYSIGLVGNGNADSSIPPIK